MREWGYDAMGFPTSRTEPETGVTTFSTPNTLGLPTGITEAGNRTRTLAFDGLGRMRAMTSGTDTLTHTYTGTRLTSAGTSSNGTSVTQTFTHAGNLIASESTAFPGGTFGVGFGYVDGKVETISYPSGREVKYVYDTKGRVTSVQQKAPGASVYTNLVTEIGYDTWGYRNLLKFASGARDNWTANAQGTELERWSVTPAGTVSGETRNYLYDTRKNLASITPDWTSLTHDVTGRLTAATGFGATTSLAHDGFGNNTVSNTSPLPTGSNNFNFNPMVDNRIPPTTATGAATGWQQNGRGEATAIGTLTGAPQTLSLGWDNLGRMTSATISGNSGVAQSYSYAPSGMRLQTTDTLTPASNRRYAYTSGGLLLGEYGPGGGGRLSGKSVKVYHASSGAGALSRSLGAFAVGDVVNVSLWFKAPAGVSAAVQLHDGKPNTADDNKLFKSMVGNGGWQQLTLTWTLTKAATLRLHLYGDMATTTSSTTTTAMGVQYDDLQVTSVLRNTVLTETWEAGMAGGADPNSTTTWYSCGQTNEVVTTDSTPSTWKRDIVYLGGEAIAEIDVNGVHELHNDHLGSPRIVTSGGTGLIEGRKTFGPYGEALPNPRPGGLTDAQWAAQQVYQPVTGYTGHIQQDPTGLIYMRGRFFTPSWHRFVTSDQGMDSNSWNQMAYVGGSPFQATDPSGMYKVAYGTKGTTKSGATVICNNPNGCDTASMSGWEGYVEVIDSYNPLDGIDGGNPGWDPTAPIPPFKVELPNGGDSNNPCNTTGMNLGVSIGGGIGAGLPGLGFVNGLNYSGGIYSDGLLAPNAGTTFMQHSTFGLSAPNLMGINSNSTVLGGGTSKGVSIFFGNAANASQASGVSQGWELNVLGASIGKSSNQQGIWSFSISWNPIGTILAALSGGTMPGYFAKNVKYNSTVLKNLDKRKCK